MFFSTNILAWYAKNKRDLPWRNTRDPYQIWLSEIILQQTRVAQGTPYYQKFISNFPSVENLADASEERILKLWQGLGYYSRARNLHATAKKVSFEFNGNFPQDYKNLIKLKGIGDYTASAIASFCFNEPEAVVDGNVYRVLSRFFGVDTPINSPEGVRHFKGLAKEVMSIDNIRDYNQGIMEFGALQCVPRNPDCHSCPISSACVAFKNKEVDKLPVKLKKLKVRKRYFNYIVPIHELKESYSTQLNQRVGKGIWQNLYEFPLLETDREVNIQVINDNINGVLNGCAFSDIYIYNEKPVVHKLSHQHLYTTFWIAKVAAKEGLNIKFSDLEKYPVPVLIADFIKAFKI